MTKEVLILESTDQLKMKVLLLVLESTFPGYIVFLL